MKTDRHVSIIRYDNQTVLYKFFTDDFFPDLSYSNPQYELIHVLTEALKSRSNLLKSSLKLLHIITISNGANFKFRAKMETFNINSFFLFYYWGLKQIIRAK
jgi:hypothetical protein